jgi:ribonuclease PH
MRPVSFEREYMAYPAGSCLAAFGETKVICTASIEPDVPPFLLESGQGWITAEYAMLPGSTPGERKRRDKNGRSAEIRRFIGRSLRAAVDLPKLGPLSIVIDCDVLQADGGTRTVAVSGGWVALYDALKKLAEMQQRSGPDFYLRGQVAAVSVGMVGGEVVCDMSYEQDHQAGVDMNIVKRDEKYVEIQGTGEQTTFSRSELMALLDAADQGILHIFQEQAEAVG